MITNINLYENLEEINYDDYKLNDQLLVCKWRVDGYFEVKNYVLEKKIFDNKIAILRDLERNTLEIGSFQFNSKNLTFDLKSSYRSTNIDETIRKEKFMVDYNINNVTMKLYFKVDDNDILIKYFMKYEKQIRSFIVERIVYIESKKVSIKVEESNEVFKEFINFILSYCDNKNNVANFIKFAKIFDYDADNYLIDKDIDGYNFFKNEMIHNNTISERMFDALFNPIYTTKSNIETILKFKMRKNSKIEYILKNENEKKDVSDLTDDEFNLISYLISYKTTLSYVNPKNGRILSNDAKKIFKKKGYFILEIKQFMKKPTYKCFKYFDEYWIEIPEGKEYINLMEEYTLIQKLTDS